MVQIEKRPLCPLPQRPTERNLHGPPQVSPQSLLRKGCKSHTCLGVCLFPPKAGQDVRPSLHIRRFGLEERRNRRRNTTHSSLTLNLRYKRTIAKLSQANFQRTNFLFRYRRPTGTFNFDDKCCVHLITPLYFFFTSPEALV
jgi:hypothetical protein